MLKLAKNICRYIEYLREIGLSVSVHFEPESITRLPYSVWSLLLPYNSHNNPYCMTVKGSCAEKCLEQQKKIRAALKNEPFMIECHAGVLEYVFPVLMRGRPVGYAALSGYRGSAAPIALASARVCSLSVSELPIELARTLFPPLAVMLGELFSETEKLEDNEENMISQYLAENHTTLTFDNFCRHFSRSRSYMSHKFSHMFGTSFSDYCNALRLEDARRMLSLGTDSVTDIALASGFGDVSYFIRLFKARYGSSPLKYRKTAISEREE